MGALEAAELSHLFVLALVALFALVFGFPTFHFFRRDAQGFPPPALKIGKWHQRVIVYLARVSQLSHWFFSVFHVSSMPQSGPGSFLVRSYRGRFLR